MALLAATATPGESDARQALAAAMARLDQAEWREDRRETATARLQAAGCYRRLGDDEAAEALLRQALADARRADATDLMVLAMCAYAETACARADALGTDDPAARRSARERARDGAFEAALLALRAGTEAWVVAALQRMAQVLCLCGDHDDAATLQARAQSICAAR